MKVGLLYPSSNTYPGISFDFMDGLNALLGHQQIASHFNIIKEGIGFGAAEKEVYMKAEKLLLTEDVDVLVIYADEKVTELLNPLIMASGKLLMVINPGANYPHNWISQPGVVHLSLQQAFMCRLAGGLAAAAGNGYAAYVSSYYDCGYLHGAAIVQQLLQQGGNIRYNYINRQSYNDSFEIGALTEFLSTDKECSNLVCVFDTMPAQLFYKHLAAYDAGRMLNVFASPMMLEAGAVAALNGKQRYRVTGFTPWHSALPGTGNITFMQQCKRPANIFSLLGWETGLMLAALLPAGTIHDNEAAVQLLKDTPLQSPRGIMLLDDATHFYTAPFTKITYEANSSTPQTEYITEYTNGWKAFTAEQIEGHVTGWTNTYLCY
ncbi:MAG: hypothetical protein JST86_14705 [Bacteroidetes bacterium]|nr:hypothetical protein [Bacteroidota bacterium]